MRTVNFKIPKSWIELSPGQLLFVAKLFLSEFAQIRYKFLTHVFLKFAKLKVLKERDGKQFYKLRGEKPFTLTSSMMRELAGKLSYLLAEVTEIKPLRKIRRAKACNYRLYKTKFIRFLMAENFYIAFSETKEKQHLNCLVATLYNRPGRAFDDKLIKRRSRYYRFVGITKKYTVYLWYSGFRWYVAKECPEIFSSGSGSAGPVKIKEHIMGMIRGLSDGDVTKNDNVLQVDTWDALYELNAKAKHIREIKSKIKK